MFDTIGADVGAPKGEKDVFGFTVSGMVEALGTEELDPKAEVEL